MPQGEISRPCDHEAPLGHTPAGAAGLQRILYVSSASPGMGDSEWQALLPAWRQRNRQDSISSALLHDQGSLMQLLEGPAGPVSRLFEAIRRDPRHCGLMVLVAEPAAHRLLPGRALVAARRGSDLVPMALQPASTAAAKRAHRGACAEVKSATARGTSDQALWAAIHSFGSVRPRWDSKP